MGVKHQTGKQRKDKFYHLAKETGFRARSAFKLIQLNRKFEFLQRSRVVIDLCAAPGSWMQVARQNMPTSSICIGVDLVPIKAIPNCITLKEDITTDKCRQALKKEVKTWKADVVLHDGAPNVGKSWLHDAFKQAELTLSALALATEFLRKGGWFVTKVFRSKDYHSLIWVFKMLFAKVHATKPQASRNESAEIFVVCQGYKAPDKIDPKFLNSKYVFGELEDETKVAPITLGKPAKKVKAEGYADGEASVYSEVPVSEFVNKSNYLEILQKATRIVLDSEEMANHPATTEEIRNNIQDIKVLGKTELKGLIKWRKKLKEMTSKKPEGEDKSTEASTQEEDPIAKIDKQIAELRAQEQADAKKKRKRLLREKRRILEKLRVTGYSSEARVESSEQDLFALREVKNTDNVIDVDVDEIPVDEEAEEEEKTGPVVKQFKRDDGEIRDALGGFDHDVEEPNEDDELEWVEDEETPDGLQLQADDVKHSDGEEKEVDGDEPDLLVDDIQLAKGKKVSNMERRVRKAEMWFDKDVFESIEDEADEDFEVEQALKQHREKGGSLFSDEKGGEKSENKSTSEAETDLDRFASDSDEEKNEKDSGSDAEDGLSSDSDTDNSDQGTKKQAGADRSSIGSASVEDPTTENKKKKRTIKLRAEEFTLGSMMIHSKKARRDIIDAGYNRYAFNDTGLPAWFVEDEKKHMRKKVELDPELLAEYRKRLKDVDVRPIKKVAEAKARKKRRQQKRLEKARKRAETVMEKEDSSTMEKARELKKIYARARGKKKEDVKYVVAKKSTTKGKRAVRPAGVKGRFKVVDPRMKKDLRAAQNKAKTMNRGKGRGKTKNKKK